MSVSSYSSQCSSCSSSSSSSSSGSSSTSSDATGKFSCSSKASISSCSTIVEAQPTVRPFGHPVFNYFWIERRSKSYPMKKYYWNLKSHSVVWERPVPRDVPLPIYTNTWTFDQRNISDNEEIMVSDPEDAISRKRRLAVKLRNRRLIVEEEDKSIRVLSVKKTIKSKKMLDTFWKLYRNPGESVRDVKKRILNSIENTIKIKSEFDTDFDDGYNANNVMETSLLSLKKEPCDENDENNYSLNLDDSISIIKKDEDSDSDTEHVSRLIKQEYMMHYEGTDAEDEEYGIKQNIFSVPDEEIEKDSEDEEDEDSEEDDEESVNFNNIHQVTTRSNVNSQNANEMLDSESDDNFEYEYEVPNLQEDLLTVEINEENNGQIFLPVDDDIIIEKVNWNFDQPSETVNNSALTCSTITSLYGAPTVKQITSKHLLSSKRKKRKVKTQKKKKVPKLIIKNEPCFNVKSETESLDGEKPIICDRYGVRTINYNHPIKEKPSNWQVYRKLSDSSGDDSYQDSEYQSIKVYSAKTAQNSTNQASRGPQTKDEGALELKNWFPKRSRKRKTYRSGSDNSWCESNFSDCTSIDEFDRRLIRIKREKRTSSSEREAKRSVFKNSSLKTSIKMENLEEDSSVQQVMESEILGSLTPPAKPAVDLGRVKVEVPSDLEEQSSTIEVEENAANDGNHSDSSSGSSHTCSRSSCSCCSSSSRSSSSDSDSEDDAGNKTLLKEYVDI